MAKKSKIYEKVYYHLPGSARRTIWRFILNHPKLTYKKIGNALITSLSAIG
jgi:hypothetical protein